MPRRLVVLALAASIVAPACYGDPQSSAHPCAECLDCEDCVEGPTGPLCQAASQVYKQCFEGHVHWFDFCDRPEEIAEECPDHFECANQGPAEAVCQCANHWEGEDCEICPGNWDPAADCAECYPGWQGEDCEIQPVCVRYVDSGATHSEPDGLCWPRAFTTLQEGIEAAYQEVAQSAGVDVCQVWVAEGTYYAHVTGKLDSFDLQPGAHLYGGFGGHEVSFDERDLANHVAILDGRNKNQAYNYVYHVVSGSDDSVLDGFHVRNGKANTELQRAGGGMYNYHASPIVANCKFYNNDAYEGAAIYNYDSAASFSNVDVHWNDAFEGSAAISSAGGSAVTLVNCTLAGNDSPGGAALFVEDSEVTVVSSILWSNTPAEIATAGAAEVDVSYSAVEGGYVGTGNLSVDPQFAGAVSGNFRLGEGSPCIDAADGAQAPELDLEGNPRVDDPDASNTGVGPPWADIGAYEHQP